MRLTCSLSTLKDDNVREGLSVRAQPLHWEMDRSETTEKKAQQLAVPIHMPHRYWLIYEIIVHGFVIKTLNPKPRQARKGHLL